MRLQAKQWDAALDWELKQQERAQMRFKAHEHEKRMTRQVSSYYAVQLDRKPCIVVATLSAMQRMRPLL